MLLLERADDADEDIFGGCVELGEPIHALSCALADALRRADELAQDDRDRRSARARPARVSCPSRPRGLDRPARSRLRLRARRRCRRGRATSRSARRGRGVAVGTAAPRRSSEAACRAEVGRPIRAALLAARVPISSRSCAPSAGRCADQLVLAIVSTSSRRTVRRWSAVERVTHYRRRHVGTASVRRSRTRGCYRGQSRPGG